MCVRIWNLPTGIQYSKTRVYNVITSHSYLNHSSSLFINRINIDDRGIKGRRKSQIKERHCLNLVFQLLRMWNWLQSQFNVRKNTKHPVSEWAQAGPRTPVCGRISERVWVGRGARESKLAPSCMAEPARSGQSAQLFGPQFFIFKALPATP